MDICKFCSKSKAVMDLDEHDPKTGVLVGTSPSCDECAKRLMQQDNEEIVGEWLDSLADDEYKLLSADFSGGMN